MQLYFSSISQRAGYMKFFLTKLHRRSLHLGEHFVRGSVKEIELRSAVSLAGRKYLPSSHVPNFPKFLSGPRENYPYFVKAQNGEEAALERWAKRSREVIEEAYEKYEADGSAVAILFRGLPVRNANDFSLWANNLGFEKFRYVGGTAPRNEIEENIAEGALDEKEFSIEPHSEMAYSVRYPKIFTMGSFKTAPWGGETAMCDVRQVFAQLEPSFVEKCEEKGVRYWHYLPDEKSGQQGKIFQSWQMQFITKDRGEVEAYLKENGYSYEWEKDCLFYWNNLPPFISHARTGEQLWFNQVTANHCSYHASSPHFEGIKLPNKKYPFHTTYGDGEEFEEGLVDEHRRVTWESAVAFQWQDGDVLFLDQLIVQHSRLSFKGNREVGISLLNY